MRQEQWICCKGRCALGGGGWRGTAYLPGSTGSGGKHVCWGGAGNTCIQRTGRCMRCRRWGAHGAFRTSEQMLPGCQKLGEMGTLPARGVGGIWDANSAVRGMGHGTL